MPGNIFPTGTPVSKRLFDLFIALPGLVLLSPVFLFISSLILIVHGRPILFRQTRAGFQGKPFTVYKFRTMNDARDSEGNLLPDSDRITPLGVFLRTSSLDELPELFNVIRGEMSIVGPRPLLVHYIGRYSSEQFRRHHVTPGITGWAQVNGRNALTWDDKFRLDLYYVDNWSFGLDLKIILLTLWKWLKREGINQPGHVTAEEFMGEQE